MQASPEDRFTPQDEPTGRSRSLLLLLVLALIAVTAGLWGYLSRSPEPTPQESQTPTQAETPPVTQSPSAATEQAEPEPMPEEVQDSSEMEPMDTQAPAQTVTVASEPLPALAQSDDFAVNKATELAGDLPITPLLAKDNVIRNLVVFIDNLAEGQLARKQSPLKGPDTKFSVSEITAKTYLNPDSYKRYDLYANYIASLDGPKLLNTYELMLPLLEQAFDELGYAENNFKARSLKAIDQLLAAPIIETPIELVTFSVNYKFADPALESLPAAQKLLIRMGPDNSRKIKAALKRLKAQLQ